MEYYDFIKSKMKFKNESGLQIKRDELNSMLFEFQKDLIIWTIKQGKAALFTMTGTGKSYMEIEYARIIHEKTEGNILILTPLAVSAQMIEMAKNLNVELNPLRINGFKPGINITNYQQLHNVNPDDYIGIILDESSIIKNFSGKIRNQLIEMFDRTPYKLCATATPAPNDFMEIGNHSEFLNQMTRSEMLSMFFINDASDTGQWRLKGHAENEFWKWVSSWAAVLTKPSDLGYDDNKYKLPKLKTHEIVIESEKKFNESLFVTEAETLGERREARRLTIPEKVEKCAEMINKSNDIWLVWCDLNIESDLLKKAIDKSVEIKGSDDDDYKEKNMLDFAHGKIKCLITKPSIAGFGMNWQVCHNVCFIGLSDSFELYFQAVRRVYRFGQKKEVNVYIFTSNIEGAVLENIKEKEKRSIEMIDNLLTHTISYVKSNVKNQVSNITDYNPLIPMEIPAYLISEDDNG